MQSPALVDPALDVNLVLLGHGVHAPSSLAATIPEYFPMGQLTQVLDVGAFTVPGGHGMHQSPSVE